MSSDHRATVGVFDSGVGGLTVVGALHGMAPALAVHYLADTAWFPYGDRPEAEVAERAVTLAGSLLAEGCALIVVACNTASSAALERLRATFDVPIVGMEPPLKPAVEQTRSGRVAVLVTAATARGDRLARLRAANGGADVEVVPAPGLVALVEAGEVTGARVERLLAEALTGALERGADRVALGCTHYGFLREALERMAGPGVAVIDAAEPVARRVLQQLDAHGVRVPDGAAQPVICTVTGAAEPFEQAVERLRAAGASIPPLRVARVLRGAGA